MLAAIDAVVVHRRRPILVGVVTAAVGLVLALLLQQRNPRTLASLVTVFGLVLLVPLVMSSRIWGRSRPAMLVVDPQRRSFRAPSSAPEVYLAATTAVLPCLQVAMLWSYSAEGRALYLSTCVAWTFLAAVRVADAWRGTRLHLRPEGIEERGTVSSLVVPWDAVDAGRLHRPPLRAQHLALPFAQPGLVRRRGLGWNKRLSIDSVHPWFIADALRHYVEHPEHRAAIGTPDEYQRLLTSLAGGTYPADNP
ncbi:hypothetical protein [Micromonospora inositola]|uniref:PH domain-containing protein n=1 Tax=Micromonospora inositola TaxID=47865 RepID=A0A1C5HCC2_9ACTN|nr:hypothetical protein [Micromonospora inositola]SCG43669.1 hypothetical protein GA0070613_1121 [Micromonospora inositola]